MADASFEDGADKPLRLMAQDPGDLEVISTLVQDAVFPAGEMKWTRADRRFAMLVNRFRWEDVADAKGRQRTFERVQSLLTFDDVMGVQTQGVDRSDTDTVLSVLSLTWHPGEDGAGRIELNLAGDGALALDVETIEVALRDVTRPYVAPSGKMPGHDA